VNYTGTKLTEGFEGCRLVAYQDVRGVWTIGYGHTGSDVREGQMCSPEQADYWLQEDMAWATGVVNREVKVPVTQEEFNALVDLVFNIGGGNFDSSTLLRELNAGDYAGAAEQFARWDMAGGKVVAGLLRRRLAEADLFKTGVA
jgi:lysozyme